MLVGLATGLLQDWYGVLPSGPGPRVRFVPVTGTPGLAPKGRRVAAAVLPLIPEPRMATLIRSLLEATAAAKHDVFRIIMTMIRSDSSIMDDVLDRWRCA